MDQNDPFESALSSMVSSPTASNANNGGENIVLRELIGRLGSICNSGEISPFNGNNSTNTSCYSTPLNSPPKLNLSSMMRERGGTTTNTNHFLSLPTLAPFSADPGFAERAARFSCFASKSLGGLNEVPPDPAKLGNPIAGSQPSTVQENWESALHESGIPTSQKKSIAARSSTPDKTDSRENSTVSEQIPAAQNDANSRKRKSAPKGKAKELALTPAKDANIAASENSESSAKRSKSADEKDNEKQNKDNSKPPEPPKDYIHVRARRGQATDAHSLAERVRREKISERMKVLQDLVPGCNKVTGKAVMLDEIINYVQSLQRQVEFLSMKLATVNPRMEFNVEALMSKDMFQSRGSLPHNTYPSDSYPFPSQSIPCGGTEAPFPPNNLNAVDSFGDAASQVSSFWEDDLHSIVQMGFGQGQTQNFQGILPTAQMKVEL